MSAASVDVAIVGGGLAGSLAALALRAGRPELSLLVVDQQQRFGGNHVWSFFDTDVDEPDRWLVSPLVTRHWDDHEVTFPRRERRLGIGYNSIRSEQLDRVMRERLQADQFRLGRAVLGFGTDHVMLEGGECIAASCVIDARGPGDFRGLDLAWQKFVGRTYRVADAHGVERPVIMDARLPQDGDYRFLYLLPFGTTELMAEDTYYSTSRTLDVPLVRGRLDELMRRRGIPVGEVETEEQGVLPVLLGGEVESLWPGAEPPVARLGLRGGFFHPTTGYSLPDAVRNAVLLAGLPRMSTESVHHLFSRRARELWQKRRFYQKLNRMLFHAAAPDRRYKVLEHFYRLPEAVIGRFYAGETSRLDKIRILTGRPPVPVGRAIAALRGKAA